VPGQDSPSAREQHAPRGCGGCGAPLSRYNPGPLCHACTSAGRDITAVRPENVSVNAPKVRELRRVHGMTQQLLADRAGVSLSYIEKLERGSTRQPSIGTLSAIAATLNVPLDTLLRQGPRQDASEPAAARAEPAALAPTESRRPEGEDRNEPHSSVISAVLAEAASGRAPAATEPLALVLTGSAAGAAVSGPGMLPDISALASEADDARRQYQACRYSELVGQLPGLLSRLDLACATLAGDARAKACALSADAYHVAAGLLLKFDDQGLACLAADRSLRAAQASADPVTVGASARIITHTLMSGGHLPAAVSAANSYAARLDHDMGPPTPLTRCPSTGPCCCEGPSPQPSTTIAGAHTNCSARPTRQPGNSAQTATCAGPPSAPPMPCCTA
jgi:transcriptional regulator with XRE-family HTH domain